MAYSEPRLDARNLREPSDDQRHHESLTSTNFSKDMGSVITYVLQLDGTVEYNQIRNASIHLHDDIRKHSLSRFDSNFAVLWESGDWSYESFKPYIQSARYLKMNDGKQYETCIPSDSKDEGRTKIGIYVLLFLKRLEQVTVIKGMYGGHTPMMDGRL